VKREKSSVQKNGNPLKNSFKTGIKNSWRSNLLPEQGWDFEAEGLLGAITDDWSA